MSTPRDPNLNNSLIHLYRGELGRMTSYRVRLDTTTNWAVVTTAGIVTFALGNAAVSHVVFIFAMILTLFFLNLEAHRFRIYETAHRRVRLLELGFLAEALGGAQTSPIMSAWSCGAIQGASSSATA